MNSQRRQSSTFPLRLPRSVREQADGLAEQDGISLNQFISLAVAEKVAILTCDKPRELHSVDRRAV